MIHVYSYNQLTNEWEADFKEIVEEGVLILDAGKTLDNEREQVAIGGSSGSDQFLSFILLGSKYKKNVIELINMSDGAYFQGQLNIKDKTIRVCEMSQATYFKWNGTKFDEERALCNPEPSDIKEGDIVILYSINENEEIISNYPNDTVFKLKEGQRIHFVRENIGAVERILINGDNYTLIPAAYNFKNAYIYSVQYDN